MVKINGESITGGINAEPVGGNHLPAVEGAAEASVEEFSILTRGTNPGEYVKFPTGGSTSFAGIAPRKTTLEQGGTAGLWVQYDSMARIVSGIYPARIEKTDITANQEILKAGSLLDASTSVAGCLMESVGNPLARLVDDLEFEAADDAQHSVAVARVVIP